MNMLPRIGPAGILRPGLFFVSGGLQINRRHPLAYGLQTCLVPDGSAGLIDLAKPRRAATTTKGIRSRGPVVCEWTFPAADTADLNFTGPFSVALHAHIQNTTAGGSFADIMGRYADVNDSNNQGWECWLAGTDEKIGFAIYNNNNRSANAYLYTSNNSVSTVGPVSYAHTSDGTTRRTFLNGRADTSSSLLNNAPASCSAALEGDPRAGSTATSPELYIGCAWSRALSTAEVLQFHHDPMCLVEPVAPMESLVFQPSAIAPPNPGAMFAIFPA